MVSKATLTVLPGKLRFGSLADQGLPFYTGCLTYTLPGSLWEKIDSADCVYLKPGKFHGALLRVETPKGVQRLGWDPIEADITDAVNAGADVKLTLVGTRRNTFGPLHLVPVIRGSYGPGSFVTEGDSWSDDYAFIESGIEEVSVETRR